MTAITEWMIRAKATRNMACAFYDRLSSQRVIGSGLAHHIAMQLGIVNAFGR